MSYLNHLPALLWLICSSEIIPESITNCSHTTRFHHASLELSLVRHFTESGRFTRREVNVNLDTAHSVFLVEIFSTSVMNSPNGVQQQCDPNSGSKAYTDGRADIKSNSPDSWHRYMDGVERTTEANGIQLLQLGHVVINRIQNLCTTPDLSRW